MLFSLSLQIAAIGPDQLAGLKKSSVIVFYVEQSEKCQDFMKIFETLDTKF